MSAAVVLAACTAADAADPAPRGGPSVAGDEGPSHPQRDSSPSRDVERAAEPSRPDPHPPVAEPEPVGLAEGWCADLPRTAHPDLDRDADPELDAAVRCLVWAGALDDAGYAELDLPPDRRDALVDEARVVERTNAEPDATATTRFRSRIRGLPPALAEDARRFTWRPSCPIHLDDLLLVEVVHLGLDGGDRWGQLVVHADVASDVATAFGLLHASGFPIERIEPIERYEGDDDASMAANNTSAFNCRTATGSGRWSEHAYGWAIDINPVHNPYVRGDTVLPEGGRRYLDRDDQRPGMLGRPGSVEVFDALGWGWGGDWNRLQDHQHVSLTGR